MPKQLASCSLAVLLSATALAVVRSLPLPPHLQHCPKVAAEGQARAFIALCDGRQWSQCPMDTYLTHLHSVARTGDIHILDIGSNKGYSAASFMSRWSPALGFSAPALYAFYRVKEAAGELSPHRAAVDDLCGACSDCKEPRRAPSHPRPASAPRRNSSLTTAAAAAAAAKTAVLHVYSYEASEPHFNMSALGLRHFLQPARANNGTAGSVMPPEVVGGGSGADHGGNGSGDSGSGSSSRSSSSSSSSSSSGRANASNRTSNATAGGTAAAAAGGTNATAGGTTRAAAAGVRGSQWHLTWAAVGDREGVMPFQANCHHEACDQSALTGELLNVTLTTVDAILRTRNLTHVDFLKIDTNGFDSTVLRGAAQALAAQRIGMLIFEYHWMGLWAGAVTLKQVVDELAGHGYVCYMAGRPTLSRMTHCWSDLYEAKAWSNVLCTAPLHFDWLEAHSFVGTLDLP